MIRETRSSNLLSIIEMKNGFNVSIFFIAFIIDGPFRGISTPIGWGLNFRLSKGKS